MENYKKLEKALSEPLDPEREMHERSRYTFVSYEDKVHRVRRVEGGSFLTGTSVELIYTNPSAGAAINFASTGEVVLNTVAGMGPQPVIPPYFWLPQNGANKTIRIMARGLYSTTSNPTFTWTARLGAAASTSASIIGITGAITAGTTQTNIGWEFEEDVQMVTLGGTGANSTVRGFGQLQIGLTNTTIGGGVITGGAAASSTGTVATVDISITNYLNMNGNCGSASASNILQVMQLLVFGLN